MKRAITLFFCLIFCVTAVCAMTGCNGATQTTYLRIHIRANSNGEADQKVKLAVRDGVVAYLTPQLKDVGSFERAVETVENSLSLIEDVADGTLVKNGFSYHARACVREEDFPMRKYDGVVLAAGRYRALIVELGTGTGDNWWCVAYPPLCFGGGDYKIQSAIVEFFKSLF